MTGHDVIIVGGGPGGSTAGALLARAGRRGLILEKETFPRFQIGESLLPFGNAILEQSGAWEKVRAAGFIPKLGAEFVTGNGAYRQRFWFRDGLFPEYPATYQVERATFDEILLRHAAESGCEVRQGTAATAVQLDASGATVTLAGGATVRSRWLVDASGRATFLARTLQVPRERIEMPRRVAIYGHFENVFRYDGEAAGHIVLVRLAGGGWCWFIPFAGVKTSVGLVMSREQFQQLGGDAAAVFAQVVAEAPELSYRLRDARRVGELRVTGDYTYGYEQLAFPRALLVGDAGTFIDPIFSSGVFLALHSAANAARLIVAAGDGPLSARAQRGYTRELHRLRDIYLRMIRAYYDNDSFAVFMQPTKRLKLVQTVNGILAGYSGRRFGMWWRLELFHLICRLQHRVRLAPPLDFAAPAQTPAPS